MLKKIKTHTVVNIISCGITIKNSNIVCCRKKISLYDQSDLVCVVLLIHPPTHNKIHK